MNKHSPPKKNSRNVDALVRLDLNEFEQLVPPTREQLSEKVWLNEC